MKLKRHRLCRTLAAAAVVVSVGSMSAPNAMAHGARGVLPPGSIIAGMTYGDWSAAWWQYAVSFPPTESPLYDTADCGADQADGPIFFLVGFFEPPAKLPLVRTCTVPAGKIIVFPIINAQCSTNDGDGPSERKLRSCASFLGDIIEPLDAQIDGVTIWNLDQYRAQSPSFSQRVASPSPFSGDPGKGKAVADGYWIALEPLKPGLHTVAFSGQATIGGEVVFESAIQYDLFVESAD